MCDLATFKQVSFMNNFTVLVLICITIIHKQK